jgi:hypothetical protein
LPITTLDHGDWTGGGSDRSAGTAASLEAGDVVFLPNLKFEIQPQELALFSPAIISAEKNLSFDPRTGRLGTTTLDGPGAARLRALLSRFSSLGTGFVSALLPAYRGRLEMGRTSFRPVEIAGRASSWRKDDTRLHIDSFPATPVHGRRILRIFSNVNPHGRARTWRIGEDFDAVARRFVRQLRMPMAGSATLRRWLRLTKSRRSPYDVLMLQLHDRMKADAEYQRQAPQTEFAFPAGSTWIAFTDQVSHAAMAGQYQLEQTFLLPVEAMLDARRSPLRILEGLMGRSLT